MKRIEVSLDLSCNMLWTGTVQVQLCYNVVLTVWLEIV